MVRKVLSLAEISAMTGVPINTLRYLRHQGRGPRTFKLAGRVVAYEDDVVAWMGEEYERDAFHGAAPTPPGVSRDDGQAAQ